MALVYYFDSEERVKSDNMAFFPNQTDNNWVYDKIKEKKPQIVIIGNVIADLIPTIKLATREIESKLIEIQFK